MVRPFYRMLFICCSVLLFSVVQAQPTLTTGHVLSLDGGGYVSATNFSSVGTGDFTIEAWIKTSGSTAIFSNRNSDSYGSFFTLYSGSPMSFEICEDGSGTNYATASGSGNVVDNAWHHVALVREGTSVKFYKDGVLDNTATTSGIANINTTQATLVGARGGGFYGIVEKFTGSIDDVRFWTVARTQAEIAANKDAYISPSTSGLLVNYRFDESSGSTTADATSSAYDGTLNGTASFSSSVLPVELSAFTVSRSGNGVTLRWSTATEVNNNGFSVEKYVEGKSEKEKGKSESWQEIGFIAGHGTTNAPQSYSFVDISAYGTARYRLKQVDHDGAVHYSSEVEAASQSVPADLFLGQNYPNPFNPSTSISFTVPVTGHATLKVYDAVGREVAVLADGMFESGTRYDVRFDASHLSSGLYIARLQSAGRSQTRSMMLLK